MPCSEPGCCDFVAKCAGDQHVYDDFKVTCRCGQETRPALWSEPD